MPLADAYIDPWRRVPKALITHAHGDHARYGMGQYICTAESMPIMKNRLGKNIVISGYDYNESFIINGVKFSFHSAGHIIGSAQIRIEHLGEVWVVSGDYKREEDGFTRPFEVVKCHSFITESTFGLPIYHWEKQDSIFEKINAWWQENIVDNRPSIITAYSLGKAQRLIKNLGNIGPIYCHSTIFQTNQILNHQGLPISTGLPIVETTSQKELQKALIIAPSSSINSTWGQKLKNPSIANVSGWMATRSRRKTSTIDAGFVLSDHADWHALNQTIAETTAENIFVTHGYSELFSKWLCEKGYNAAVVNSEYGEENDDGT